MSETVPAEILHALAVSDRKAYFEQRLFVRSPFGTLATSAIIFVLLAGTFAIVWAVSGQPFVIFSGGKLVITTMLRLGLWFSLMIATVLGMQRYARVRERQDIASYAAVLRGGWQSAASMTELTPRNISLTAANMTGLALGLGVSWIFYVTGPTQGLLPYPALLIWFSTVTTALLISFTRGVALTRAAGASMRRTIDDELVIDLLRTDRLNVIGRSAARPAVVWFTISAAILLVFIGGGITLFTVGLLVACAAMGVWVFIATMAQVHRKIRATKAAEVERLRAQIDGLHHTLHSDPGAAHTLQALLAYETRIAGAPEWPFDQTTLVRLGASALILTVPWFGQAIAATLVEQLGHVAH